MAGKHNDHGCLIKKNEKILLKLRYSVRNFRNMLFSICFAYQIFSSLFFISKLFRNLTLQVSICSQIFSMQYVAVFFMYYLRIIDLKKRDYSKDIRHDINKMIARLPSNLK